MNSLFGCPRRWRSDGFVALPVPPIAVEIAPPTQDAELIRHLLDACSRAASPVECVTADQVDATRVSALAIVVWLPRADSVRIQVGAKRGQSRGSWITRHITFEDSDALGERWTTAGFVVGTLASRFGLAPQEQAEREAPVAPEPAPQPVESPEPAPEVRVRPEAPGPPPRRLWFDLAAVTGPFLDSGPWRFGGMLGAAYMDEPWPVFAYSALRYSYRPPDAQRVVAELGEADLGLGLPVLNESRFGLDATAAVAVERLRVVLDDASLEGRAITHWVPGARARLEFAWQPSRHLGGVLGVGLAWWSHNTEFTITKGASQGQNRDDGSLLVWRGQQQSVGGELSLGFRVLP